MGGLVSFCVSWSALLLAAPAKVGTQVKKLLAEDVEHAGPTLPLETLGRWGAGAAPQTRKLQLPG